MLRSQMDATYPSEADLQKLIISLSIQQQRSYTEMFCRLAEIDLIRLNLPKFAQPELPLRGFQIHFISFLTFLTQTHYNFSSFSSGGGTSSGLCPEWKDLNYDHLPTITSTKHNYSCCYQWKNNKNSLAVMARHEAYFNLANAQTLP